MNKRTTIIPIIIVLAALLLITLLGHNQQSVSIPTSQASPALSSPSASIIPGYLSYQGKNGVDALSLLKQSAQIVQNNSGLVTSINGQVASDSAHEFWAFYVNGKEAQVGPSSYRTKDSDKIEWKIEKY